VNILNKLKSNSARIGLCLAGFMLWGRAASAEVPLIEKDGWTFSFGGRVNSFLSVAQGDGFPNATMDPAGGTHVVMGTQNQEFNGLTDVGWVSTQQDTKGKLLATRVRSGMFGNVLGFALTKQLSERTIIRAYVSIWATAETLGRDKWSPVTAEAREGYFTATSWWGSATVGRGLGWLGRTSYEIDVLYGHGFGVGLPCSDALGPACGHIGTGALFPGYSAGMSYSTPSIGGLQLHIGIYDPIALNPSSPNDWSHTGPVRPEGSITFDRPLGGSARIKIGVEGLVQQLGRIVGDPMMPPTTSVATTMWGVSGGARIEAGPVRLGLSGFRGKGIGLGYAGQRTAATEDNDSSAAPSGGNTYDLRTFSGFYGQGALVFGALQLGLGYGAGIVDQLPVDKTNGGLSVFHFQTGISASLYYHISDAVVLGLDYFRYGAAWYGAPLLDTGGAPTGTHLAGETQNVNFVNAGATFHW
jgi:hypothetical protein